MCKGIKIGYTNVPMPLLIAMQIDYFLRQGELLKSEPCMNIMEDVSQAILLQKTIIIAWVRVKLVVFFFQELLRRKIARYLPLTYMR